MNYTHEYMNIFIHARSQVREKLEEAYQHMTDAQLWQHYVGWDYISLVAELLTSYNELSPLHLFWRMKDFK